MAIKQYIIPAAAIIVSCEEGTDVEQQLIDLLYVGADWDDEKTKFKVESINLRNVFKTTTTELS